jgi:hypothetical protein
VDLIKNTSRDKDWKVTIEGSVKDDTVAVSSIRMQ